VQSFEASATEGKPPSCLVAEDDGHAGEDKLRLLTSRWSQLLHLTTFGKLFILIQSHSPAGRNRGCS